jgi:hypothetical protein
VSIRYHTALPSISLALSKAHSKGWSKGHFGRPVSQALKLPKGLCQKRSGLHKMPPSTSISNTSRVMSTGTFLDVQFRQVNEQKKEPPQEVVVATCLGAVKLPDRSQLNWTSDQ